jgi:multiple sugar transport system permease protein
MSSSSQAMTRPDPTLSQRLGALWARIRPALGTAVFYGFVLLFCFAMIAPFLWMIISSISPQYELVARPPHWIPENPTLHRYEALLFGPQEGQSMPLAADKFLTALGNSLIVSSITTVICLIVGTFAAYPFARLRLPGQNSFLIGILAAQMLPVIVIIIPLSLVMQRLDLIDTYRGLILLYAGFLLPTVIWIMYGYLQTIPRELEDAAMIDGCTRFEAIIRVILPLAGPGLVAVGAFTFLSAWNEFFMALIFTASETKTITVTVTEFSTQFGIDFGLMATGGVIGSLPPLLLALLLQRYLVQGLTSGALKG